MDRLLEYGILFILLLIFVIVMVFVIYRGGKAVRKIMGGADNDITKITNQKDILENLLKQILTYKNEFDDYNTKLENYLNDVDKKLSTAENDQKQFQVLYDNNVVGTSDDAIKYRNNVLIHSLNDFDAIFKKQQTEINKYVGTTDENVKKIYDDCKIIEKEIIKVQGEITDFTIAVNAVQIDRLNNFKDQFDNLKATLLVPFDINAANNKLKKIKTDALDNIKSVDDYYQRYLDVIKPSMNNDIQVLNDYKIYLEDASVDINKRLQDIDKMINSIETLEKNVNIYKSNFEKDIKKYSDTSQILRADVEKYKNENDVNVSYQNASNVIDRFEEKIKFINKDITDDLIKGIELIKTQTNFIKKFKIDNLPPATPPPPGTPPPPPGTPPPPPGTPPPPPGTPPPPSITTTIDTTDLEKYEKEIPDLTSRLNDINDKYKVKMKSINEFQKNMKVLSIDLFSEKTPNEEKLKKIEKLNIDGWLKSVEKYKNSLTTVYGKYENYIKNAFTKIKPYQNVNSVKTRHDNLKTSMIQNEKSINNINAMLVPQLEKEIQIVKKLINNINSQKKEIEDKITKAQTPTPVIPRKRATSLTARNVPPPGTPPLPPRPPLPPPLPPRPPQQQDDDDDYFYYYDSGLMNVRDVVSNIDKALQNPNLLDERYPELKSLKANLDNIKSIMSRVPDYLSNISERGATAVKYNKFLDLPASDRRLYGILESADMKASDSKEVITEKLFKKFGVINFDPENKKVFIQKVLQHPVLFDVYKNCLN